MADTTGRNQCTILTEVEKHVEAIQKLIKGHGQKDLQELGDQVCDNNRSDNGEHSASFSTISQYMDKVHQVINEEKTNLQLSPSSSDRQDMANLEKEISVFDTSSIEKALNNSVVLRTIMKHLTTKDLFNVRHVAKKWEEEATIRLLSARQETQILFDWNETEHKFQNDGGTLEEFTDSCYGNPLKKFPCSQFYFLNLTTNLEVNESKDLFKFFSNHGHHVKSLGLYPRYKSASPLGTIRKIVFEWTPNLKSLTLSGATIRGNEDKPPTLEIENTSKSSPDENLKRYRLSLEHLKLICDSWIEQNSVAAQRWCLLLKNILLSAPNLKTISDDDLLFTKEIASAGKISAVHRLVWKVYNEEMIPRCIEFSQARPKLINLEVSLLTFFNGKWTTQKDPPSNFFPSLQLILQSSHKTLKTLKFEGRFDSLTGASRMNIPVLENLQEFCVENWTRVEGGQGRMLPEGFSFQKIFPRLKTLVMKDVGDETANQEDNPFGQSSNSSTTVEELTIGTSNWSEYRFHPDWLRQARDLYPNVRVLKLELRKRWSEIPDICRTIWMSWKSLEELKIKASYSYSDDCAEIMDQALTGFNRETCRMLEKQRCCKHCLGAETFERGPSIADMKKLKLFQLTSRVTSDVSNDVDPDFSLLSRVSVIHALEPMRRSQNLKVLIEGVQLTEMIQNGLNLDSSVPDCQIIMNYE